MHLLALHSRGFGQAVCCRDRPAPPDCLHDPNPACPRSCPRPCRLRFPSAQQADAADRHRAGEGSLHRAVQRTGQAAQPQPARLRCQAGRRGQQGAQCPAAGAVRTLGRPADRH
ncbi:hypothetical protein G6F68_010930 [Rhizopus microsporus]|nr:hypothetical protein G6F68_010930 [Rhizopus microsporus]